MQLYDAEFLRPDPNLTPRVDELALRFTQVESMSYGAMKTLAEQLEKELNRANAVIARVDAALKPQ